MSKTPLCLLLHRAAVRTKKDLPNILESNAAANAEKEDRKPPEGIFIDLLLDVLVKFLESMLDQKDEDDMEPPVKAAA